MRLRTKLQTLRLMDAKEFWNGLNIPNGAPPKILPSHGIPFVRRVGGCGNGLANTALHPTAAKARRRVTLEPLDLSAPATLQLLEQQPRVCVQRWLFSNSASISHGYEKARPDPGWLLFGIGGVGCRL